MEHIPYNFYPRPPRGGRLVCLTCPLYAFRFLSTPSARRATHAPDFVYLFAFISIHALREEGDAFLFRQSPLRCYFYPRPPRGGRQCSQSKRLGTKKFLSTPSARRATNTSYQRAMADIFLSTPSARRATEWADKMGIAKQFLSTPSARRATLVLHGADVVQAISIHALREEGDIGQSSMSAPSVDFYPRPPRGGRPEEQGQLYQRQADFYPRPPRGGRRRAAFLRQHRPPISIHALREEGDARRNARGHQTVFLSTPTARRATFGCC